MHAGGRGQQDDLVDASAPDSQVVAQSETILRLNLGNSSFVVVADKGSVQTCYTDRTLTSRSSACSVAALVAFAKDVLRQFPDPGGTAPA